MESKDLESVVSDEQKVRNMRFVEKKIGRDVLDFVPFYGLWNYSRRAWSVLKNLDDDKYGECFYVGYMDKVALYHFATSVPLMFVAGGLAMYLVLSLREIVQK